MLLFSIVDRGENVQIEFQPCFKFDFCYLLAKFELKSMFLCFLPIPVLWMCPNFYCCFRHLLGYLPF